MNVGQQHTMVATVPETNATNYRSQIFSHRNKVVDDIEKYPRRSLLLKNVGRYSICCSGTGEPRQPDLGEPRTGGSHWDLVRTTENVSLRHPTPPSCNRNNSRVTRTAGRGRITGKGTLCEAQCKGKV